MNQIGSAFDGPGHAGETANAEVLRECLYPGIMYGYAGQ